MTDVAFDFQFDNAKTEQGPAVQRAHPSGTFDLFAGEHARGATSSRAEGGGPRSSGRTRAEVIPA